MPNDRSVTCVKERHAQSVPFADCVKYASCISLCLFEDVLWIDRDFLCFDDPEQTATHKKGVINRAIRRGKLFNRDQWAEQSMLVYEAGESQLIFAMKDVEAGFQGIKVFSLPSMGQDGSRIHVELGVRGAPDQVGPAMERLRRLVKDAGFPYK